MILVVEPDVNLAVLTTAGLQEPRADWSEAAQTNLAAAFEASLNAEGHSPRAVNPDAFEGRADQLIRLHEAVGASILQFNYGPQTLPTHPRDQFAWTLGPGTRVIEESMQARYALFVTARGSYASGGRMAAMIGLAILGVGIPLGGQQMFASLVDLQTGDVIWFNVATASPNADMRTPEGARMLVADLMEESPL
ncbi:MAG: hypothetical protein AB7J28_05745 [Hyphomonadaceae bacterium]